MLQNVTTSSLLKLSSTFHQKFGEFQPYSVCTKVMGKPWMKGGKVFHMPSEILSSLEHYFIFSQGFLLGEAQQLLFYMCRGPKSSKMV